MSVNWSTEAHDIADEYGFDGSNFYHIDPGMDEYLDDRLDEECTEKTIDGDTTRYQFRDGSAIIISNDAWDLGVHRDRLDKLRETFDDLPETCEGMRVEMTWVGAGYGVSEDDAYPPETDNNHNHNGDSK